MRYNVYASDALDSFTIVPLINDTEDWSAATTVSHLADVPPHAYRVFDTE